MGLKWYLGLVYLRYRPYNYPSWLFVPRLRKEVKFIDRDPHWYTRRVKEAIHIRLHPNNINRDSGIEIPEAWIPTFKKHNSQSTTSRPVSEQHLIVGIIMRLNMLQIATRKQSTSSPDED